MPGAMDELWSELRRVQDKVQVHDQDLARLAMIQSEVEKLRNANDEVMPKLAMLSAKLDAIDARITEGRQRGLAVITLVVGIVTAVVNVAVNLLLKLSG